MDEYIEPDGDWSADSDVDRAFWQLTTPLVVPEANECLVCFLVRVVPILEPDGLAMTRRFRDTNAPRATNLGGRLMQMGIFGDALLLQCGVIANSSIWQVVRCPDCGIPEGAPPCCGVRKGSTQPCQLWFWRKNPRPERFSGWADRYY